MVSKTAPILSLKTKQKSVLPLLNVSGYGIEIRTHLHINPVVHDFLMTLHNIHSTNEYFMVHSMNYILTNFLFMDTRLQCQDKLNKTNEFLRPF